MTTPVPDRRGRSRIVLLLVASLALNAFFIGALVTEFLRFRHFGGDQGPRAEDADCAGLAAKVLR